MESCPRPCPRPLSPSYLKILSIGLAMATNNLIFCKTCNDYKHRVHYCQ